MPAFAVSILAVALVGMTPQVARANDHLNRVVEVFLAAENGDRSVQFVELLDNVNEELRNGPYSLEVRAGDGTFSLQPPPPTHAPHSPGTRRKCRRLQVTTSSPVACLRSAPIS